MNKYTVTGKRGKHSRSETRFSAVLAEVWVDELKERFGHQCIIDVFDHDARVRITESELRRRASLEREESASNAQQP